MITRNVSRWNIWWFLACKVPVVLWAGVKVRKLTYDDCITEIKRNWRNGNPYGGVYFANQLAAAEMASGLLVFTEMQQAYEVAGINMVARITDVKAEFYRPVSESATFACFDGQEITQGVIAALNKGKRGQYIDTKVLGRNAQGKLVASIDITWCVQLVK